MSLECFKLATAAWTRNPLSMSSLMRIEQTGVPRSAETLATGLNKGNDALIKKHNINVQDVGNRGDYKSFPSINTIKLPTVNGDTTNHMKQLYGPINSNFHHALCTRHEIDELRISGKLKGEPSVSIDMPSFGSHFSPEVLTRESKNVAGAPLQEKLHLFNMRTDMTNSVRDSKPRGTPNQLSTLKSRTDAIKEELHRNSAAIDDNYRFRLSNLFNRSAHKRTRKFLGDRSTHLYKIYNKLYSKAHALGPGEISERNYLKTNLNHTYGGIKV